MGDAKVKDLGKYRLIAELAHGGMGDVYLAIVRGPAGFNKIVVVKELRPSLTEDPQFLGMFLDEARLAARLNHPNIVQTNEIGKDGDRYFLAMEYLEGQTLYRANHRLSRSEGLRVNLHLRILADVCAGVHYAHELTDFDGRALGVVHRDVTPHNVFLTYDGGVKVVDFGIAKALDSTQETRTGVLKGKVPYMCPEQARGEPVDRRADVFSIGVMLFEAATGSRMWKGVSEVAVLHNLVNGNIPRARLVNPTMPEALDSICQKALAPKAADRYATCADFQADLEAYLAETGEAVTLREVGKRLSEAFQEERANLKSVIDGQLKEIKLLSSGEFTAVPMLQLDFPSAPSAPTSSPFSSSGLRTDPHALHAAASGSLNVTNTRMSSFTDVERPRSRSRLIVAGVAAVGVAVIGVVSLTVAQRPARNVVASEARPTIAPDPDAAPHALVPSAAVILPPLLAAEKVEITVRVSPEGARLFLDDAPLRANPFLGTFPRDGLSHRVRAEANGYLPRTELLTFDQSATLSLALERQSSGAQVSRPQPPPAKPQAPVVEPPPVPAPQPSTKRPKRAIETDDPYAR